MTRGVWAAVLVLALIPRISAAAVGSELHDIERRIHALSSALDVTRSARVRTRDELESSERQLGHALARLRVLDQRVTRARLRGTHLQGRIRLDQRRLNGGLRVLAAETRAAYALRRRNYWTLLLDQDHPERARRILAYYRYVVRQQAHSIAGIKAALVALSGNEQQLRRVTGELKALAGDQLREEEVLRSQQARRMQALAGINRRVESQKEQLRHLHAARRRLRRLVERLRAARPQSRVPPMLPAGLFAAARGRLPPPLWLDGATRGAHLEGVGSGAPGLFFPAPSGTPVHAVFAGRVAYANWLRGFGLLLILEHEGGYMTVYAHVQSLYRRVGDQVTAGEVVAATGRSGGFRRPGLYFQIRHDGQPLNPLHWLRR
ncbi:MAG: murein hydrolase activator EnvC family protein [Acidiferrobacteraceae bacterium]